MIFSSLSSFFVCAAYGGISSILDIYGDDGRGVSTSWCRRRLSFFSALLRNMMKSDSSILMMMMMMRHYDVIFFGDFSSFDDPLADDILIYSY